MAAARTFNVALAVVCLACVGVLVAFAIELRDAARAGRGDGIQPPVVRWTQIGAWSGSGTGTTSKFTVTARHWRFRWVARPVPLGADGQVTVVVFRDGEHYPTEVPLLKQQVVAPISDETPVTTGPGTFWLRCNCPEVWWTLSVDQSGDSTAPVTPPSIDDTRGAGPATIRASIGRSDGILRPWGARTR